MSTASTPLDMALANHYAELVLTRAGGSFSGARKILDQVREAALAADRPGAAEKVDLVMIVLAEREIKVQLDKAAESYVGFVA